MSLLSWFQRQARWKRIASVALISYLLVLPINLLLRLALRGWQWHPDILVSALITTLMMPAIVLVEIAMVRWFRH